MTAMSGERTGDGELIILSAPSGAGKTTLIHQLGEAYDWPNDDRPQFSVSHTTRSRRTGEADGVDYHFVDRDSFRRMIADQQFLEWAEVHGELYGTSRHEVVPRLEEGHDVILDIDVQGAAQVMARYPRAQSVFVVPPSYRELERRLLARSREAADEISRRLAVSLSELKCYSSYKYVIVNDDAARAGRLLVAIILEKRQRLERMEASVRRILDSFGSERDGSRTGA